LTKQVGDDSILFPNDPEKIKDIKSTSLFSPRQTDSSLDPRSIIIEIKDGNIN